MCGEGILLGAIAGGIGGVIASFATFIVLRWALGRKRSEPVEARQWTGNSYEICQWLGYAWIEVTPLHLVIENRDGRVRANLGDWIVKDDGFYPVEPVKFQAEYEAVQ